MADTTNSYTTNSSGQITTINGQPITETVVVTATPPTIPVTAGDVSPALIPSIPLTTLPLTASVVNPNSRGVNDVSDIRPTAHLAPLPIRGEKRLLPVNIDASQVQQAFNNSGFLDLTNTVYGGGIKQNNKVQDTDFYVYANTEAKRLQNAVDYMKIRIPHRGVLTSSQLPDPTQSVEYRFLINPATLTVNRQTVDSQSLTRGGWQFGVWGEDCFMVQMQGTSAGSYFSLGTTDELSYYAVSYRNLMQLQEVFENNGYWFEGEEYNEGPLAADYLRRRIRMHQDVELWCGNFIWSGMFDSFTISQDATQPFMLNFNLSFFVWKERYRSTSPYWDSIENNVQRGHSYQAVVGQNNTVENNSTLAQYVPAEVTFNANQLSNSSNTNGNQVQSAAVLSSNAQDHLTTTPTIITDQMGVEPLKELTLPTFSSWGGVSNPPNEPIFVQHN